MGDSVPLLLITLTLVSAVFLAFPGETPSMLRLRRLTGMARSSGHGAGPAGQDAHRRIAQVGKMRSGSFGSSSLGLRDPAMILELVAAMLEAGSGLGRALELVANVAADDFRSALKPVISALAIGTDWDTAWRSSSVYHPDLLLLRDALGFAAHTGAPSAAILYAQAARIRRARFRSAEKRAAALGVKLVIPLGLCSLPAFVCLGVVPVLLALVPTGN